MSHRITIHVKKNTGDLRGLHRFIKRIGAAFPLDEWLRLFEDVDKHREELRSSTIEDEVYNMLYWKLREDAALTFLAWPEWDMAALVWNGDLHAAVAAEVDGTVLLQNSGENPLDDEELSCLPAPLIGAIEPSPGSIEEVLWDSGLDEETARRVLLSANLERALGIRALLGERAPREASPVAEGECIELAVQEVIPTRVLHSDEWQEGLRRAARRIAGQNKRAAQNPLVYGR